MLFIFLVLYQKLHGVQRLVILALINFKTCEISLDHLLNLVSARFIHFEVTIFLFVTDTYVSIDILRLKKYPLSSQTSPTSFNDPW